MVLLGRILAEQGQLDEAIKLFETVKRDEQYLSAPDETTLANWYLVKDRKEDYRKARVDAFMGMEEWNISNWLGQKRRPFDTSGQFVF